MLTDFQNILISPQISKKVNALLTRIGKKCSMTILDAGCGNGQFSQLLISLGVSNVVGVDFSHNMIMWAKERSVRGKFRERLDLALGKLENLNFKDESFDVVFMFGVMEHLEDPHSAFREVRRVLRKGGKLILDIPRKNSSSYFTFLLFGRSPKWWGTKLKVRHILKIREKTEFYRFFDKNELEEMIAVASMRLVTTEPTSFFHYGGIGASLVEKMLRNKIQIQKALDIIFERVLRTPSGELVLMEKCY
jgi:ubiquinone/menaquinone biosynthesis C-methylase UbiE